MLFAYLFAKCLFVFSEYRTIRKGKFKEKKGAPLPLSLGVGKMMDEESPTFQKSTLVPFSVELHPNVISSSDMAGGGGSPKSPTSTNSSSSTLKRSKSMPKRRTSFRGHECNPS